MAMARAPQLMKGAEERMMFLRFNYCKLRLPGSAEADSARTG